MIWRILTGEYPPQAGGVGDYTKVIATALAACGDQVHVWTPGARSAAQAAPPNLTVHRIAGWLNPAALRRVDRELRAVDAGPLLVQYVPHAFGCKGMNLLFCLWLFARRRWAPSVMFHELMFPVRRADPWRYRTLGRVTRLMARLTARAAARIYVSTPLWDQMLREQIRISRPTTWLPLPSTIPSAADDAGSSRLKARYAGEDGVLIGHLSSYPQGVRDRLARLLPVILEDTPRTVVLLLGLSSAEVRQELIERNPALSARLHASGALPAVDLSRHLSACDLMLQLYADGACARRTTLIAALAHARAIVCNQGAATEELWAQSGAIALATEENGMCQEIARLVGNPILRGSYAAAALQLYREKFDLTHCIERMRADAHADSHS